MKSSDITTLFLDIGGVLLTNGWDRSVRKRAAETYDLDYEEMDERHHLTFDTYEEGKLSLDEYLNRVVFYEKRTFSPDGFKNFMLQQSRPYPEMIELIRTVKSRNKLAGDKIQTVLTHAPGNGAPIGGLKVVAESGWVAARPSGIKDIYKIYAESFRGADHLRRILEEAQNLVNDAFKTEPDTSISS